MKKTLVFILCLFYTSSFAKSAIRGHFDETVEKCLHEITDNNDVLNSYYQEFKYPEIIHHMYLEDYKTNNCQVITSSAQKNACAYYNATSQKKLEKRIKKLFNHLLDDMIVDDMTNYIDYIRTHHNIDLWSKSCKIEGTRSTEQNFEFTYFAIKAALKKGTQQAVRIHMANYIKRLAESKIGSHHYSYKCNCGCFALVENLEPVLRLISPTLKPRKKFLPTVRMLSP